MSSLLWERHAKLEEFCSKIPMWSEINTGVGQNYLVPRATPFESKIESKKWPRCWPKVSAKERKFDVRIEKIRFSFFWFKWGRGGPNSFGLHRYTKMIKNSLSGLNSWFVVFAFWCPILTSCEQNFLSKRKNIPVTDGYSTVSRSFFLNSFLLHFTYACA